MGTGSKEWQEKSEGDELAAKVVKEQDHQKSLKRAQVMQQQ